MAGLAFPVWLFHPLLPAGFDRRVYLSQLSTVDVLTRIERHPARLILDLTPAYWKDLIVQETGRFPALHPDRTASPRAVHAVAAAP